VLNTQGSEETRQIASRLWGISASGLCHRGSKALAWFQAARLCSIYFSAIEAGESISIQNSDERNKLHLLYIVDKGRLKVRLPGGAYICDPGSVAVVSTQEKSTITSEGALRARCLAIPTALLESRLSALLRLRNVRPVLFFPVISRSDPGVEALLRFIGFLFQECDRTDTIRTKAPRTARQLEETFLANLFETWPHNYSNEMVTGLGPTVPWYVLYSEEYIKTHLDQPISMGDLAEAVKKSARTIHEGFRRHRRYSPMEFRLKLRLDLVRTQLLDPTNSKTVTDVGMNWCFWHLGRFSKAYFKAFGERPSQTLARAKNTRGPDKGSNVGAFIPPVAQPLAAITAPAKAGAWR